MTLSDLSVRRPVFAAVAAIILCVVGLASFTQMTVRELPAVDPPVISISTDYRGASSEVIEERITEVIERQVAGIEGVDRMTSGSRDGSSRINIQFKLSRDLDAAANDVRDAVSRVSANLPLQADPPQIRKADADAQPIIFLGLSSTTLNRLQLTDYANRYLVERVSTVPGVAQVGVGGAQNYAMRIWLDPQAMASRDITVTDVENALNAQNLELPAGALEAAAKDFTIRVARGYSTAEEFANLPVVTPGDGGYVTRLGDIARVSEEADERRRMFRSNGRDLVGIAVTRQSQANDLEISDGIRALLPELNRGLPEGTELNVAVDFTLFTRHALEEVWITMGICLAIVGLVNFIFLGTWRAAIIPTVVAPICILSTFIVLAPLGFSLNLLTLLALVLAIGLVVDDAIVVVENIQRRIDEGEPAPVAAQLNEELAEFTGVRAIAYVRPALRGSEGNSVDLIAIGAEYDQIADWLRPIQAAAEQNPGLARVRLDYEPTSPRLLVTIDREKAAALGVTTQAVGRAMETMFGSRRVTTYIREGREYDVILQTGREERMSQEDLNNLYVRSESGETIPLASVVTSEVRGDTPDRERTDRSRSINLSAQLNPGYTIGDAIAFFEAEVDKQPGGVGVIWGGGARDYLEAGGAVGLAFGLALLLVFLVLAAQFESWIHPGVIMLTVPVAALGGLFGLLVAGSTINTYSQIGLIILVGIAAKNGILIVEFANQLRDEGLSIREAVIEASTLRLRPIIMTSISAAAGAIPLIVWGGAGGESRRSIGVVIFFGAIFATMLTLFIVPVFYNLLARFTKSPEHMARRIEAFEEAEQARVANAAE